MSDNKVLKFRRRPRVGIPRLHWEWVAGRTGHLWIGEDEGTYLGSLTATEARRLRDFLSDALGETDRRDEETVEVFDANER